MNITSLVSAAETVLGLLEEFAGRTARNEREFDQIFYGYLKGCFASMRRQHPVRMYGSRRPHRIDFRQGGTQPAVIELAVRPAIGGSQLHGSSNQSELRKLARVKRSAAQTRFLLLVDLSSHPLSRAALKATYDPLHAGRGRFE